MSPIFLLNLNNFPPAPRHLPTASKQVSKWKKGPKFAICMKSLLVKWIVQQQISFEHASWGKKSFRRRTSLFWLLRAPLLFTCFAAATPLFFHTEIWYVTLLHIFDSKDMGHGLPQTFYTRILTSWSSSINVLSVMVSNFGLVAAYPFWIIWNSVQPSFGQVVFHPT